MFILWMKLDKSHFKGSMSNTERWYSLSVLGRSL